MRWILSAVCCGLGLQAIGLSDIVEHDWRTIPLNGELIGEFSGNSYPTKEQLHKLVLDYSFVSSLHYIPAPLQEFYNILNGMYTKHLNIDANHEMLTYYSVHTNSICSLFSSDQGSTWPLELRPMYGDKVYLQPWKWQQHAYQDGQILHFNQVFDGENTILCYFTTSPDGQTWSEQQILFGDRVSYSSYSPFRQPAYLFTDSGAALLYFPYEGFPVLFTSQDRGTTWSELPLRKSTAESTQLISLDALDKLLLWDPATGVYQISQNFGVSWSEPQNIGPTRDFHYLSSNTPYSKTLANNDRIFITRSNAKLEFFALPYMQEIPQPLGNFSLDHSVYDYGYFVSDEGRFFALESDQNNYEKITFTTATLDNLSQIKQTQLTQAEFCEILHFSELPSGQNLAIWSEISWPEGEEGPKDVHLVICLLSSTGQEIHRSNLLLGNTSLEQGDFHCSYNANGLIMLSANLNMQRVIFLSTDEGQTWDYKKVSFGDTISIFLGQSILPNNRLFLHGFSLEFLPNPFAQEYELKTKIITSIDLGKTWQQGIN